MQHDGKVRPLDKASTELATHAPLARLPVILLQVHDKAAQQLKCGLNTLFDNADRTLFEMADNARDDAEQSLLFKAMRDVRLKRKNIERRFLERFSDEFFMLAQLPPVDSALASPAPSGSMYSLMANDLERRLVIDGMVARVLARDGQALCQLTTRLNSVAGRELDDLCNPMGPARLCEYFLLAERDQGVEIKVKLIILRLFEQYLLSQTLQLYTDANQLLIATGVLPELATDPSCCRSEPPIAATNISPVTGVDVSNLVGLLFEYIAGDRNLPASLKSLIGRLQAPMLVIAQQDQSFFSCDNHPARQLLNAIAAAAIGWDNTAGERGDPLYLQIDQVVQQLARHPLGGSALLEPLLQAFLVFSHSERSRIERLEREHVYQARQVPDTRPVAALASEDHLGLLLLSQLRTGSWIELQEDEEHRLRCKLIAINESTGQHVFVSRTGMKVLERSRAELIAQLRSATIVLLDERQLFDRALESVINSLGHFKAR